MLATKLRGARTHNLAGIDLDVRPGEVLVLSGVSGSGKSSLALDTLYAEGQRRFVESFSPYARQFLERLPRPPMDSLDPVAAGVAVDRSAPIKSSRSTVATMADLEPYLAGLFSKEAVSVCPEHGEAAVQIDAGIGAERVIERFSGALLLVTRPLGVGDKESYLRTREDLLRQGHRRVVVQDKLYDLDELKPSVATKAGKLHVVLDRLRATPLDRDRLAFGLEAAFGASGEAELFVAEDLSLRQTLRSGLSCPVCARSLPAPRPGFFSYESPLGACSNCRGFGRILGIDLDKVIPDDGLSLEEGAIRPWRGKSAEWERKQLADFCAFEKIPMDKPWRALSERARSLILSGAKKERGRERYHGVLEWFEWLETKAYKMHVRVLLSRYRSYNLCPVCQGTRLNERARSFHLLGLDLGQFHALQIREARARLLTLETKSPQGELLRNELLTRLGYLERVGLGYLTLDRQARTLSGGEAQRVTLTAALGTSLHGAMFVLDEPTVGLHPGEVHELIVLIRELAQRNNAVIVIEHDPAVLAAADRIVELGPKAGPKGGRIVKSGPPSQFLTAETATGRALLPLELGARPEHKRTGQLVLSGAAANNLDRVSVSFPLGQITGVSGPSGSGKSSLLVDVLYRALARRLKVEDVPPPGPFDELTGDEGVTAVELVDQSPLGRTSRGNAATYTKAWDVVRKGFASEPTAVLSGFTPSTFSFNVEGGRCDACSGEGFETVEMQFLADVALICPECGGRRFKSEVLSIVHRGLDISQTLELSVDEALERFADSAAIRRALTPLAMLGLGYLKIGQPLSTLSGGEAQRLKLARALASPQKGCVYVLDEPSAGLHTDEVRLLVRAFDILVQAGATVLFVDHDLELLKAADHVLELGPGGGKNGGRLVFSGSPTELFKKDTATGRALRAQARGAAIVPPPEERTLFEPSIVVRGAREHTLRGVDVSIPHGKLTTITGPSGSGKSTLAFDVVFAEGQRRFLETLTPYARRFLPTLPRPDVDAIDGVPPSIALEQRTTRVGTRSTVATVTEVAHFLRLAFAKLGTFYCPDHDVPIEKRSAEDLFSELSRIRDKGDLLAPAVQGRKGSYAEVFRAAAAAEIPWAIADGRRVATEKPPRLAKTREHTIELVMAEGIRFDRVDQALLARALGWGRGSVVVRQGARSRVLSLVGSCPECGFSIGDVDPRYFSFNTKQGQCETCEGTGRVEDEVCEDCGGTRLSPFARRARLLGRTYPEIVDESVGQARKFLSQLEAKSARREIAEPIARELLRRLEFLGEVGLDYLSLSRDAQTLSGGEMQRLRLAAQLGSGLTGALYVLDEPTIGLHPTDTGRLLNNLRKLVDAGSTVLMVEHDEDAITAADYVIDMGPGGGRGGGQVIAQGPPAVVLSHPESKTALALRGQKSPRKIRDLPGEFVELKGASLHNLTGVTVKIPVGRMTVACGVSGSGKSSLIGGVLLPAVRRELGLAHDTPGPYQSLVGHEAWKRAIAVDQSPIGRTSRSVPATFLGIFDEIRALYARIPEAQVRGLDKTRFSFNSTSGGRCETCAGQGVLSHEMSFLPDVVTVCPTCDGLRFDERTLAVTYRGLSIGQVLQLTAEEALEVFSAHPKILAPLRVLVDLGAGYVQLGQSSATLSGGEAQRLKLAAELCAGAKHEPTLYVLDEPTTGLHLADVERLIEVLDRLIARGDTLVIIEHHPLVLRSADWLVELGPGGGPDGGRIVAEGPPSQVKKQKTRSASLLV